MIKEAYENFDNDLNGVKRYVAESSSKELRRIGRYLIRIIDEYMNRFDMSSMNYLTWYYSLIALKDLIMKKVKYYTPRNSDYKSLFFEYEFIFLFLNIREDIKFKAIIAYRNGKPNKLNAIRQILKRNYKELGLDSKESRENELKIGARLLEELMGKNFHEFDKILGDSGSDCNREDTEKMCKIESKNEATITKPTRGKASSKALLEEALMESDFSKVNANPYKCNAFIVNWDRTKEEVKKRLMMPESEYKKWIMPLEAVMSDYNTIFLSYKKPDGLIIEYGISGQLSESEVTDDIAKQYIEDVYFSVIKDCLRDRYQDLFQLVFLFEDQIFIEDNGFLTFEYSWSKNLSPYEEKKVIERIKACGGWYGISDVLIINRKAKLSELISSKESIVRYLSDYRILTIDSIREVAECVWSKRYTNMSRRWDEYRVELRCAKVPEWYIWLCEKYIGLQ